MRCHGFTPYLFAPLPPDLPSSLPNSSLGAIRQALDMRVRGAARSSMTRDLPSCVLGVDVVSDVKSLTNYHPPGKPLPKFLQIFVAMPGLVPTCRKLVEDGLRVELGGGLGSIMIQGTSYESNVPFLLRFMVDCDVRGGGWLEAPPGSYSIRSSHETRSQLEIDLVYTRLISHPCDGEWSRMAPLRVLSFDIECMGRKGHFPEAEQDPVIQIANVIHTKHPCGEEESVGSIGRMVLTLDSCLPIPSSHVSCSPTEVK